MQNQNNDVSKDNPDFYTVNSDYRTPEVNSSMLELVNYRNNSFMRVWYNQQTDVYPLHWHSALEIIMPVDGDYQAAINDISYRIEEGGILIIPPGELHSVYPPPRTENGTRFLYLFDVNLIAHLKDFAAIRPLLTFPIYITRESCPAVYDDVRKLLDRIQYEYFCDRAYSEFTILSLLLNILVILGTNYLDTKMPLTSFKNSKQHEYFQKFNDLLSYIDTHYMEKLTLDDMAARAGFSKFHFSRLFKQYTNYTFCDYLNYRRIKATEELLQQPHTPIMDIAMQVGYASLSTFNRLFREYKKCSPSEYRAKHSAISSTR